MSTSIIAAGCAHEMRGSSAIDRTLAMCALLSVDGVESVSSSSDDEAWYWFQVERVNASRQMWNRGGIRALETRIASTPEGRDRVCLERALREARAKTVEYFGSS
jgi:hypothetical protein